MEGQGLGEAKEEAFPRQNSLLRHHYGCDSDFSPLAGRKVRRLAIPATVGGLSGG